MSVASTEAPTDLSRKPDLPTDVSTEPRGATNPPGWYLALLLGLFLPLTLLERSFTAGAGQSVWTPALGIMFGIMVLYGNRWVPILVATLLGVTAVSAATSTSAKPVNWPLIAAVVAVIVAGFALGAELARRIGVRSSLRRLSDAAWLAISTLIGTAIAISAVLEVVQGLGYLKGQAWWPVFSKGFASAGASTLAVAPLILLGGDRASLARSRRSSRRGAALRSLGEQNRRARHPAGSALKTTRADQPAVPPLLQIAWVAENVVLAGCFAGTADLALAHGSPGFYPMLIPLGWLALRRGIGGTSVGVAVGTLALSLFAHSIGLKVGRINQLEMFLLVFALCGLCFGAAQTERHDLANEAIEGRRALAAREAQLRTLVETLQERVNRDTLTQLPLKSLFMEYLVTAQARIRRSGQLIAVLYLDVDGFKQINDRYGHRVGDAAIRVIADRLRQTVRILDSPARAYEGGDEFLILCDELSGADEAYVIAERIRAAVAEPLRIDGAGTFHLSTSLGVAFAGPYDDPDLVVERADAAMLDAKRELEAGRERSDTGALVLDP